MKRYAALLLISVVLGTCPEGYGQTRVTIRSLLREMTDPGAVTKFPSPEFYLKQASSYDRRSYEPQGKGGNTLYLPLPYQKHCKVTWQFADSANMRTSHYYQINYRTYPAGTLVETFATDQLKRYRTIIQTTDSILRHPPSAAGKTTAGAELLAPGKTLSVPLPDGASAIRLLRMALTTQRKEDQEKMWRSVMIRIEFDGHQTVLCPLGDFIGIIDPGWV